MAQAAELQSTAYGLRKAAAQQRAFVAIYRALLGAEALYGLALLFVPGLAARVLLLPRSVDLRLWGVMLLFGALLQVPGLLSPVHARLTVMTAVVGRGLLAIAYVFLLAWPAAIVTGIAALAIGIAFTRLIYAEIGSKP